MDGEWGDWIALWGPINILQLLMPVAIVSSLGETGLKVISPADCQNEAQATGLELWPYLATRHYHSLEPLPRNESKSMAKEKSQKKFVQNVDENSRATHSYFREW